MKGSVALLVSVVMYVGCSNPVTTEPTNHDPLPITPVAQDRSLCQQFSDAMSLDGYNQIGYKYNYGGGGASITYTRDALGCVLNSLCKDSTGSVLQKTTYSYDELNLTVTTNITNYTKVKTATGDSIRTDMFQTTYYYKRK